MAMRNPLNRRTRTRIYGGVAGESGQPLPLCRFLGGVVELRTVRRDRTGVSVRQPALLLQMLYLNDDVFLFVPGEIERQAFFQVRLQCAQIGSIDFPAILDRD
jgi:hypothetical protein